MYKLCTNFGNKVNKLKLIDYNRAKTRCGDRIISVVGALRILTRAKIY